MDKGREKRCQHFNHYNLRLTRYRRQRVEIPQIDMRGHTRFLPDNDNEGELVAVDHYELAVPRQQRHRQQHHRRRPLNRQRAHPEQHQRAQVQQQQAQRQNVPRGGSVWSETEDKLLFKAVAHYKRYNNSSSLQWSTVLGNYSLLGGAAVDVRQLKVHWKIITGLKKSGHLNDCSFFNDPDCSKDFDLVFEEASSSSRSSSSTATRGTISQSFVRSSFVPVQGDLSPENRRFLEVLVANTLAINELVRFQMIDERQAAFAKERFANAHDQPSAMTLFSFLTTSVQRAEFIRRAFSESHP